jgi:hypothetical protein
VRYNRDTQRRRNVKLLTKALEAKLPPLYSTEDVPTEEKVAVVKFFTPDSNWTWYAVEGEKRDDDFLFFGLVDGFEREWGYFVLSELESARGPLGLPIERDLYFDGKIPS